MSTVSYAAGPGRPAQLVAKPLHCDGPSLSIGPHAQIAITVEPNHVRSRAELAALLTELQGLILTHLNHAPGEYQYTPLGSL